jgi:hypothetical protein
VVLFKFLNTLLRDSRFYLFIRIPCPSVLRRTEYGRSTDGQGILPSSVRPYTRSPCSHSHYSHLLNSRQPPTAIIFIHIPNHHHHTNFSFPNKAFVSNIRSACNVKYVTFRIFETYAMLNMLCFEYSKRMRY